MIGYSDDFDQMGMVGDNDFTTGRQILTYFHNASKKYPLYTLQTVDDLINVYGKKGPIIADGLGLDSRILDLSMSEIQEVMEDMAQAGAGKVPEHFLAYHNAIGQEAMNPSFWKALTWTTTETLKELHEPFAAVGQGLLSTMKMSKYMLPVIIYGGIGFIIWKNSGALGDAMRNLSKGVRR